jgi:hypothetical protein
MNGDAGQSSGTTQSSGGKSICQKLGEGFTNSMPICDFPACSLPTYTTRHSRVLCVALLATVISWAAATRAAREISAPCALTTSFFVKLLIRGRFALHRDRHAEQHTHTAAPAGISDELLRFLLWCCWCAHAATIAPASVLGNGTIFLFTLFSN